MSNQGNARRSPQTIAALEQQEFERERAASFALSRAEAAAYCEALCDQRADQLPEAPEIRAYIVARANECNIHVTQHRFTLFDRMTGFLDGFIAGQESGYRLGYQSGLDDAPIIAAKGGEA